MKITYLKAKTIKDSRKENTVEVLLKNEKDQKAKASLPQGKSRGSFEAKFIKPEKAVLIINQKIAPRIKNKEFKNLETIEFFLKKINKSANIILPISIAFSRLKARELKIPLWQYLRKNFEKYSPIKNYLKPKLIFNIIGGGLHAQNNLIFQEYLIIPKINNFQKSWLLAKKIYLSVGQYLQKNYSQKIKLADEGNYAPFLNNPEEPFLIFKKVIKKLKIKNSINFGLDAAASNINLKPEKLKKIYLQIYKKYPLLYLEDPFKENDFENFKKLKKIIAAKTYIIGDDLTTTNPLRIKKAFKNKAIDGIIIKPNQIGSLVETFKAVALAKKYHWFITVSHRSGETEDDFISDLAYGLGAAGFKGGAPLQKERFIKYKRLITIEKNES